MTSSKKIDLSTAVPRSRLHAIMRIVLLYAGFAALWILFSDQALEFMLLQPGGFMLANTVKGLLFVAVTSLLLFYLLLRFSTHETGKTAESELPRSAEKPAHGLLYAGIFLLAVVFVLIGAVGIKQSRDSYREAAGRQLQAIAQLKVAQLEDWLSERHADLSVAASSPTFNTLFAQWLESRSPELRKRLGKNLETFMSAYRYQDILICDAQGNILIHGGSDSNHPVTDVLRDSIARSLASGEAVMTDFHFMVEPMPRHAHLDFVAPLLMDSKPKKIEAALILRSNVESSIFAYLATWPVPSKSAETVLFYQEGGNIHHLSPLRHRRETTHSEPTPLTNRKLLAAQALASDYLPGDLIEGVDYRGMSVVGVAQPVPGTSWWLLAKTNRDEIFSTAHRDALWIGFATLLTWLASATLAILLLQRSELQHSRQQRYEQARQLNAMKLLSDIAHGSADAIYAKDRQGRYLMFNHAACGYAGKSEEQVVGQDDTALFPLEQADAVRANDKRVMDENRVITSEEVLNTTTGTRTFLAIKGPLHDDAGRVIGVYGISRDISERKAGEEKIRRHNEELQRFNQAMVGRELEMIRLKREVNQLAAALGQQPPYALAALDDAAAGSTAQENGLP
jgi:PAS domain S-box-containing protein